MIQRGNGAGFAFESLAQILPLGDVLRQNLDGDDAVEPGVARLPHLPHAAGAKGGEDLIWAEARTG